MSDQRESRHVRNKDILLLREVRSAMVQIESMEKRAAWENKRRFHITQNLSKAPSTGGTRQGLDEALATIDELTDENTRLIKRYARKIRMARRVLSDIESTELRSFVTMMYLDNATDKDVRDKLKMSRWQFENARKAVERAPNMKSVLWNDKYTEDEK